MHRTPPNYPNSVPLSGGSLGNNAASAATAPSATPYNPLYYNYFPHNPYGNGVIGGVMGGGVGVDYVAENGLIAANGNKRSRRKLSNISDEELWYCPNAGCDRKFCKTSSASIKLHLHTCPNKNNPNNNNTNSIDKEMNKEKNTEDEKKNGETTNNSINDNAERKNLKRTSPTIDDLKQSPRKRPLNNPSLTTSITPPLQPSPPPSTNTIAPFPPQSPSDPSPVGSSSPSPAQMNRYNPYLFMEQEYRLFPSSPATVGSSPSSLAYRTIAVPHISQPIRGRPFGLSHDDNNCIQCMPSLLQNPVTAAGGGIVNRGGLSGESGLGIYHPSVTDYYRAGRRATVPPAYNIYSRTTYRS